MTFGSSRQPCDDPPPGFVDRTEAVIAVMDIGEAREQVWWASLFCGIEIAGVDHVDHGVGGLGQFVACVVFLEKSFPKTSRRADSGG